MKQHKIKNIGAKVLLFCILAVTFAFANACGNDPDTQAVQRAKDALAIIYAEGDSERSVTQNFTLPLAGENGVIISWDSDNSAVINFTPLSSEQLTGNVNRPGGMDTQVILTATLIKNNARDERTFTLMVIPLQDAEAVQLAKNALVIIYAEGDSERSVTQNVMLPVTGENGVSISWMSSNHARVNPAGAVNRHGRLDAQVTLTAVLTKNDARDTKTFKLVVPTRPASDGDAVMRAKNALAVGYAQGDSRTSVTQNVSLPTAGSDGVVISWASSDPSVISRAGVVVRPDNMNTTVTLTATLAKNDAMDTKTFDLVVMITAAAADAQAVANAKGALAIGYAQGDTAMSVTQNVSLPTAGSDGVVISWASSTPAIVSRAGRVTRPPDTRNTQLTLTATLTKNAATDTRIFPLTVIARPFAWSKVTTSGTHWSARSVETVAFDGKLWVLGGHDDASPKNDVWWSSDGMSWTNANARGPAIPDTNPVEYNSHWSGRWRHATVVFDGKIWVLGGNSGGSYKSDIWRSSDGTNWTQVTTSGTHWSGRRGHRAVVFDGKMWVLGGNDTRNKNDVWWSSDGMSWTNANARGPAIPDTNPVEYNSHWDARGILGVVVLDNKLWVLGGSNQRGFKNDVWSSSDGTNWTQVTVTGTHWSPRTEHAAVVFDGKMWVLGGQNGRTRFDHVWWSSDGMSWAQMTAGDTHWSGREEHSAVVLDSKMWVLGGSDGVTKNDVWVFQETGG